MRGPHCRASLYCTVRTCVSLKSIIGPRSGHKSDCNYSSKSWAGTGVGSRHRSAPQPSPAAHTGPLTCASTVVQLSPRPGLGWWGLWVGGRKGKWDPGARRQLQLGGEPRPRRSATRSWSARETMAFSPPWRKAAHLQRGISRARRGRHRKSRTRRKPAWPIRPSRSTAPWTTTTTIAVRARAASHCNRIISQWLARSYSLSLPALCSCRPPICSRRRHHRHSRRRRHSRHRHRRLARRHRHHRHRHRLHRRLRRRLHHRRLPLHHRRRPHRRHHHLPCSTRPRLHHHHRPSRCCSA